MLARFPLPLRRVFLIDAATCLAMGLLLVVADGPIAALTAIPAALLFYAGLGLIPIAGAMLLTALRPVAPLAWLMIAGNVAWVVASLALLATGRIAPNALGVVFILAQATAVALLAFVEHAALRGASSTARLA